MNSTLALISGLGLETSGLGLGLGLETPGLVNIPAIKCASYNYYAEPSRFLKNIFTNTSLGHTRADINRSTTRFSTAESTLNFNMIRGI